MKKIRFLRNSALLTGIIMTLLSCEKVIDIDLNSNIKHIVIEGNITNLPGPYTIKLSQTVNFNEENAFYPVSGASVTLCDDQGNSEILMETTSGVYVSSAMQGVCDRTYTLKVSANGKEYIAKSYMYPPVNIDTLTIVTEPTHNVTKKTISVGFKDPGGIANYYRFIKTINNVSQATIYVEDDLLQDGNSITQSLLTKNQKEANLKNGDIVGVALQSIDKNVYNYFRTLKQLNGSSGLINQSTAPANPVSNLSNGALGFFNAYSVTYKEIKINK